MIKRVIPVLYLLLLPSLLLASEKAETVDTSSSDDKTMTTLPIGLFVQTDVKQMLEEAETRMLLRKLMNPKLNRPDWIPAYSTAPRGNPLDESRSMNVGLNLFGTDQDGKLRGFAPYEGFQLRTWEETPDIILDREGARDFMIRK